MTDPRSPLRLQDFAGLWQVDRQIDDRLGQPMRFGGQARLSWEGDRLIYDEQGQLWGGNGPPLVATRRYLWHADGIRVAVTFEDGRPFHHFDPSRPGSRASHHCAPDQYDVRYEFGTWPVWQSHWQVRGPRKDYAMQTFYRRQF